MQCLRCCFVLRRFAPLAVFALSTFAPTSWATDVSYDFVACTDAKITALEASAELTAFGSESWGVVSSSTNKDWENATTHCVGYLRIMAGKPVGKGVCKWRISTGETAVGEYELPAVGEASWHWLIGTGKLKGITGSGTFKSLHSGSIQPGTTQGCRRDWGSYTLP